MKSQLLAIRTTHHVEESQLDQMLGRHQERAHDHISFLVSPPCHATNFMRMEKFELASTADEAQGSTSRTVAGGKGDGGGLHPHPESTRELPGRWTAHQERGIGTPSPDFSILHRPHIVRPKEEVHVELCHECERMATGHCECGNPICLAHRYDSEGTHAPDGMCGDCHDTPQDRTEVYGSNGRQV